MDNLLNIFFKSKSKSKSKTKKTKTKTRKRKNKNKKGGTKTFKTLRCHPSKKRLHKSIPSCYDSDDLNKLKNAWNRKYPSHKIIDTCPIKIWSFLKNAYQHKCDRESCWINELHLDLDMIDDTFAPEAPEHWKKNPNAWLSDADIRNVMQQYEETYPCFLFLGPSSIDYYKKLSDGNCVCNRLCNFNLKDEIEKHKIKKIGVVFNTDPHTRGGEHWISLFIDIPDRLIYFFDSVGSSPPDEVKRFIKTVTEQGEKLNIKFKFEYNRKPHQKQNTECGVYSIYFIIHMLRDDIDGDFIKRTDKLTDRYIEQYRKIFFNDDL